MIEATDFRDAMSLLPTGSMSFTTKGDSGCHGFTSAVCSVTDTPPTFVCMNQSSRSHEHFLKTKR